MQQSAVRYPGSVAEDQTDREPAEDGATIRLRRIDVLRLNAAEGQHLHVDGDSRRAAELKNFLDLKSVAPLPDLKDRITPLRTYQVRGAEWLWFLFENGFGGTALR